MAKTSESMTILEHLNELRRRLFIVLGFLVGASIVCFIWSPDMLDLISRGITLIYIRPSEALLAHIRLAVTGGFVLTSPILFYHLISFLLPALSSREKRVLISSVFTMFLLFTVGIAFAWFVVFPFAMSFFASFATEQLLPWYTVSDYVSFVTSFLLGFGLVFQLPMLFWLLGALGLISSRFLRGSRKYALVIVAIVSAVITPPDVVSQVLMIIPMMVLYEIGIWLVVLTEVSRKKRVEAEGLVD